MFEFLIIKLHHHHYRIKSVNPTIHNKHELSWILDKIIIPRLILNQYHPMPITFLIWTIAVNFAFVRSQLKHLFTYFLLIFFYLCWTSADLLNPWRSFQFVTLLTFWTITHTLNPCWSFEPMLINPTPCWLSLTPAYLCSSFEPLLIYWIPCWTPECRIFRYTSSNYITLHFKRHLHLKWPVVHQQLHVIRNTAHHTG